MAITFGYNYSELINDKINCLNVLSIKVVKKDYGYYITKITSYVSVIKVQLTINSNGSAKAVFKIKTNYRAPYQYTKYYDTAGLEIIGEQNTREALLYYKSIQD